MKGKGRLMSFNLVPDLILNTFDELSAEKLNELGIKGIILDIDNTLEPYENLLPGEHVVKWLDSLRENGIKASIVSNNNSNRVNVFNASLCLPAYYHSFKPFKSKLVSAMRDMGTDKSTTLMMGDQILTDVWAAHNAGIMAVLVAPINDKRDLFTRFKRLLEKPFLTKYEKRKNK